MSKSLTIDVVYDYVNTNKDELLAKAVTGFKTIDYVSVQTGVLAPTAIHVLDTNLTFGDGSTCGFTNTVNQTISARMIDPRHIKVNAHWCQADFYDTWANQLAHIGADKQELPFAELFCEDIVKNIQKQLEKEFWKQIIDIGLTDVPAANKITSTGVLADDVEAIIKKIPAEIIENAVVFMGQEDFMKLVFEYQHANHYIHPITGDKNFELVVPGTMIKVIGVPGLNGEGYIFAGDPKNFVFGTDFRNDKEVFDFWYSKDDDEYKFKCTFSAGEQIAFPSQVIMMANS